MSAFFDKISLIALLVSQDCCSVGGSTVNGQRDS